MTKIDNLEQWTMLQFCEIALKNDKQTTKYIDKNIRKQMQSTNPNMYNDIMYFNGLLLEYLDDDEKTYEICLNAINNIREAFIYDAIQSKLNIPK